MSLTSLESSADGLPTDFLNLTGAYLTSAYAVVGFSKTKCGYAITHDAEASLRRAESEIFDTFPQKYHNDLKKFIPVAKTGAKESVEKALHTLPTNKLDFNTRCGIGSGILIQEFVRNRLEWREANSAISTKP